MLTLERERGILGRKRGQRCPDTVPPSDACVSAKLLKSLISVCREQQDHIMAYQSRLLKHGYFVV